MKKVTWRSPSNIALVKYWGKKSGVQIPANPSISFTLDQCHSETSVSLVEKEGKGVVLYMNQEGRGIGLLNKLKAYKLQEQGMDTVEANLHLGLPMDARDYGVGAQILRTLNVTKLKLISNNPKKRAGLLGYGLEIVDTVPISIAPNQFNQKYLETKRDKMGHNILK